MIKFSNPQEPDSSVRNSGRLDSTEELDIKTINLEFWSKMSKRFSHHRNAMRTVFIVILIACAVGYIMAAAIYSVAQGKPVMIQ